MKLFLKILLPVAALAVLVTIYFNPMQGVDASTGATPSRNGNSVYHQSTTFSMNCGRLEVGGEVADPGPVDLKTLYLHEVVVKETSNATDTAAFIGAYRYTGFSLLDLLNPFILQKKNESVFRPATDIYIEIENDKQEKVVFSWSEIFHVNKLHQVLIATGGSQIDPHKRKVEYPRTETWKLVAAGDLSNARYLDNPVRVTVKTFDRKDYPVQRNMPSMYSPDVKLVIEGKSETFLTEDAGTCRNKHETIFYGMGQGYHPVGSFEGGSLAGLLNGISDPADHALQQKGLVCFAGHDGYRSIFSFSELFNRNDAVEAIMATTGEGVEGGRYRIFHPADFFADRSVKSLSEIYFFQAD